MRWPFGPHGPDAAAKPTAPGASQAEHRSLAFGALVASLGPERRSQVLDLGRSIGSNIEWLSSRNCRVFVADLHRSLLDETIEARKAENFARLLERLVPLADDDRFDAVLAWDLFDYLRPDQIAALMARLAPACRPGALLLAFVTTQRQLPAAPMRYRIRGPQTLAWEGAATPTRSAPGYHESDLARLMPGFRLKTSLLLRNGIQEYLFSAHSEPRLAEPGRPDSR